MQFSLVQFNLVLVFLSFFSQLQILSLPSKPLPIHCTVYVKVMTSTADGSTVNSTVFAAHPVGAPECKQTSSHLSACWLQNLISHGAGVIS
jgi:hypothetical protein